MSLSTLALSSWMIASLTSFYYEGRLPWSRYHSSHLDVFFDIRGLLEMFLFFQIAILFEGGFSAFLAVFVGCLVGNLMGIRKASFVSKSLMDVTKFIGMSVIFQNFSYAQNQEVWLPIFIAGMVALVMLIGISSAAKWDGIDVVDMFFDEFIGSVFEKSLMTILISALIVLLFKAI